MRSPHLPWLLLALGAGVLGWALGRWSAPEAEAPFATSQARSTLPPRTGPLLEAAPSRSGSRANPAPHLGARQDSDPSRLGPSVGVTPPGAGPGSQAAAPSVDGASVARDGVPTSAIVLRDVDGGLPGFLGESQPVAEDPEVGTTTRLMAADPEAAAARLEQQLSSARPEDRAVAYRALSQARHPLHRRLAQRALDEARPGDDVQAILRTLARFKGRDWAVEQLTGPPDTPIAGDLPTAWASREQDMGEVWIEVDFPQSVRPERLRIHETFHPGAVSRVYAMDGDDPGDPDTIWIELWKGSAPTPEAPAWFEIELAGGSRTRTLRLIVDTSRVEGWNEIDAVELLGDGRRQWASAARAGSSYGE